MEGQVRTIRQVLKRRLCERCDKKATFKLTFLLPHARSNPASAAYGKDDCSWCSDTAVFVCHTHEKERYVIAKELGMGWCAEFEYGERFKHLFEYWGEIDVKEEEIK